MSEKTNRRLLLFSSIVSVTLTLLWIASVDWIGSVWHSTLISATTLSGGGVAIYGGEIILAKERTPLVLALRWHPKASAAGFHALCERLPGGISSQWGFHEQHFKNSFPVRADGSLSINAAGTPVPGVSSVTMEDASLLIPIWFPLALASAYPIWTMIVITTRRRQKRFAAGQCTNCGYDLRASPQRCPECGQVPIAGEQALALPVLLRSGGIRRVVLNGVIIASVVGITLTARELNIVYGYRPLDFLSHWK